MKLLDELQTRLTAKNSRLAYLTTRITRNDEDEESMSALKERRKIVENDISDLQVAIDGIQRYHMLMSVCTPEIEDDYYLADKMGNDG